MKIALILNEERYFYPDALDVFLAKTRHEISKVYVFPSFTDPAKGRAYERASAKIMGEAFVARYLVKLAWKRVAELLRLPGNSSIQRVAKRHGIACRKYASVNGLDFLEDIRGEGIEIGLSMVSQIYKEPVFAVEKLRLYNFHPGLLPRNKGRFPFFWAFFNGEKEHGVTCHQITPRIDDGEIVFQRLFDVGPRDTVATVIAQFARKTPEYLEEAIEKILSGERQRLEGDFRPFYGPEPTREQIRKYHSQLKRKR